MLEVRTLTNASCTSMALKPYKVLMICTQASGCWCSLATRPRRFTLQALSLHHRWFVHIDIEALPLWPSLNALACAGATGRPPVTHLVCSGRQGMHHGGWEGWRGEGKQGMGAPAIGKMKVGWADIFPNTQHAVLTHVWGNTLQCTKLPNGQVVNLQEATKFPHCIDQA